MIAHTSVTVSNYEKAKEFYQILLGTLGYTIGMDIAEYKACGFSRDGKQDFWIAEHQTTGGIHVAFLAKSKNEVAAFHEAGLRAGGVDNGGPGYRTEYTPNYYAAFVHDADKNNIEAVFFDPSV